MKKVTAASVVAVLTCLATANAATVASYSSGVLPQAGITGASDPATQGWTASTASPGSYNYGADSTVGGWRITDGTSTANFFYSQVLSESAVADMTYGSWTATWTAALVADAVSKTGLPNGVDNYYSGTPSRQNNNGMWVEVAGKFAYVLTFKADASGNVVLSDGTSNFAITTAGNQMAQEIGEGAPFNVNYVTYTLSYADGVATLTDSLGGNHGVVASLAGYTPMQNRVVWGAYSNAGQGSTVWNDILVTAVPEPASLALFGLGALALLLRRRQGLH